MGSTPMEELMTTHLIWLLILVSAWTTLSGEVHAQDCGGETKYRAPSATMQAWGQHEISSLVAIEELTLTYRGDRVSAQQYFDLFRVAPFASAPVYPRWGGSINSTSSGNQGKKGSPPGQGKKKNKEK